MTEQNVRKEFLSDLIKAQQEMATVYKDKINPHFKNKYAPLSDILGAIKPPLNKNNFFLTQKVSIDGDKEFLDTEILHINGESLSMSMQLTIANKSKPQEYGSAMTYLRRYSLTALLGLEEEDDDGEKANQGETQREILSRISDKDMRETLRKENENQFKRIKDDLEGCGSVDELQALWDNEKSQIAKLKKYAPELLQLLVNTKDSMKKMIDPDQQESENYIQAG